MPEFTHSLASDEILYFQCYQYLLKNIWNKLGHMKVETLADSLNQNISMPVKQKFFLVDLRITKVWKLPNKCSKPNYKTIVQAQTRMLSVVPLYTPIILVFAKHLLSRYFNKQLAVLIYLKAPNQNAN